MFVQLHSALAWVCERERACLAECSEHLNRSEKSISMSRLDPDCQQQHTASTSVPSPVWLIINGGGGGSAAFCISFIKLALSIRSKGCILKHREQRGVGRTCCTHWASVFRDVCLHCQESNAQRPWVLGNVKLYIFLFNCSVKKVYVLNVVNADWHEGFFYLMFPEDRLRRPWDPFAVNLQWRTVWTKNITFVCLKVTVYNLQHSFEVFFKSLGVASFTFVCLYWQTVVSARCAILLSSLSLLHCWHCWKN